MYFTESVSLSFFQGQLINDVIITKGLELTSMAVDIFWSVAMSCIKTVKTLLVCLLTPEIAWLSRARHTFGSVLDQSGLDHWSLVCLCLYPLVYWHLLSSGSSLARPGWGPAAARPVRARIVLVASLRVTGPTLAVEMSSNLLWSYTTATVAGAVTIEKHVLCSDSWARQS